MGNGKARTSQGFPRAAVFFFFGDEELQHARGLAFVDSAINHTAPARQLAVGNRPINFITICRFDQQAIQIAAQQTHKHLLGQSAFSLCHRNRRSRQR